MRQVDRKAALKNPTGHAYFPSLGYLEMGPLPMPKKNVAGGDARPSPKPDALSKHRLQSPHGPEVVMTWLATGAWEASGGKRMAFPVEYLSAHGWKYVGPA